MNLDWYNQFYLTVCNYISNRHITKIIISEGVKVALLCNRSAHDMNNDETEWEKVSKLCNLNRIPIIVENHGDLTTSNQYIRFYYYNEIVFKQIFVCTVMNTLKTWMESCKVADELLRRAA